MHSSCYVCAKPSESDHLVGRLLLYEADLPAHSDGLLAGNNG